MRVTAKFRYNPTFGSSKFSLGTHMSQEHTFPVSRVAIRWPFRVLAALICAAGLVSVAGTAISLWYDSRIIATDRLHVTLRLLVTLPGELWLLRLAAHAALHGNMRSLAFDVHPWWPFASQRVAYAYFVLMFFVLWSVPS